MARRLKIAMPDGAAFILEQLKQNGFEAYIVGGCVRDSIMGVAPNDWDICTSALPEQIIKVFENYRTILTGVRHGTVTILVDGKPFEVTTYRIDGEYEDGRHPSSVTFTSSLKEDLKRRDFTINAMAYNPDDGIVDYFNGYRDIKNHVIRCVGDPDERFKEDALRIMRAARFEVTLNFKIESKTFKSMERNCRLLKRISMERINSELCKAFSVGYSVNMARLLKVVVPEITEDMIVRTATYTIMYKGETYVFKRNKSFLSNGSSLNVRLALFLDFDQETLNDILHRLRFDNTSIKNICDIRKMLNKIRSESPSQSATVLVKNILRYNDKIAVDVIDALRCSTYLDANVDYYMLANVMEIRLPECVDSCYNLSHLAINGDDLQEIGMTGQQIGAMLNAALDAVIVGKVKNERDALLNYVQSIN